MWKAAIGKLIFPCCSVHQVCDDVALKHESEAMVLSAILASTWKSCTNTLGKGPGEIPSLIMRARMINNQWLVIALHMLSGYECLNMCVFHSFRDVKRTGIILSCSWLSLTLFYNTHDSHLVVCSLAVRLTIPEQSWSWSDCSWLSPRFFTHCFTPDNDFIRPVQLWCISGQ